MNKTKIPPEELLIGAHTSAAGGVYRALLEGKSIGATTIQLFTANQKQWKGKLLSEEAVDTFKQTLLATGLKKIMSHAGYLINLGGPHLENLKKSRQAFQEEIERCLALEISFLNFHPGAALDDTREACLDRIVASLLEVENMFIDDSLHLLLETTAGQGTCVGYRFEDLGYIIQQVKGRIPIGVCIDTCHIFAAGYDIRTPAAWQQTLADFEKAVGMQHLYAFHLNDSVQKLGSRRDRHAPLGEGEIGMEAFKFLMSSPVTRALPKYLETPGGCPLWDKEIWMLREFARSEALMH